MTACGRRRRTRLDEQVIAVTGAGHGIGAVLAAQLIAGGARVALIDRDVEAAQRQARYLGLRAQAFAGDVTDDASIRGAIDSAAAHFGRLDTVVANAGVAGAPAPVATTDPEHFEQVIAVNLLGVYRTVTAALPHLVAAAGYIVMVSSIASVIPGPTISAYAASKAGVEAFTRALRIELHHSGVDVGLAYFGLVDTALAHQLTDSGLAAVMRSFPSGLSTPIPVSEAAAALVDGIQRRSRRVSTPWWVPLLLDLRPLAILSDRVVARHRGLQPLLGQHLPVPSAPAASRDALRPSSTSQPER